MTVVFSLLAFIFSGLWLVSLLGLLKTRKKYRTYESESASVRAAAPETSVNDLGVLGSLKMIWELKGALWSDIPPYERATKLHEKYGKVFRSYYSWLLRQEIVLLADLELAKQVFRSSTWTSRTLEEQHHYLEEGSFNKPLGILFGSGEYWRESRKVMIRLLREHGLLDQTNLEEMYSSETRTLLEELHLKIAQNGGKGDFAILPARHLFAVPIMNVIFKTLFGRGLSDEEKAEGGLMDQINYSNSTFTACLSSIEYFPFMRYFPRFTFMGPALRLAGLVYDIAKTEADKRRDAVEGPRYLIDSLLQEVAEHEGKSPNYFTFEALQVNVRDLIMAGGETIGAAMGHVIQQMVLNPDMQRKVQDEIDQVIGPERLPSYDDKSSMMYTQAVILESLRIGSIVPISARTCSRDYELGGLKLKKGTHLLPNLYAIHHNAELWDDPEEFRPQRFLNEKNEIVNTEKMLPFSYGPRSCPGEMTARMAIFVMTVILLREFVWEVSPEHGRPSLRNTKGLTRYPAQYFVKIRKRTAN